MKITSQRGLIRALGLTALIIYGVGDILGAGIYALVGKIAGHAGAFTWLSFAIAMSIVLFTALSYSELGSRFPKSGGVSVYVQNAFQHKWLSIFAGLLLLCATIFSMSTLSQAFANYLATLGLNFPKWVDILIFFSILFLINLRGIKQSSIANIISTSIEITGLLIVLICGFLYLSKSTTHSIIATHETMPSIINIFQGAALAFFAFIGFEDLVNIAEEMKKPEKNLPRAILFSLGIAGILYLSVSWMATAIIPGPELSQADAPLFSVVKKSFPPMPVFLFSIIALFAVFNSALLNYITASRLLYGMSEENLLPTFLQKVHQKYHTPYVAIMLVFPLVVGLSVTGTLGGLAGSASAIMLTVFSLSCAALIRVKLKKEKIDAKIFRIPFFVPCVAIALNLTAITFLPVHNLVSAALLVGAGLIICWVSIGASSRGAF